MSHNELLDVVFRWAHVIAGIMWIGNSMLFNWLDRNLEKSGQLARLSQGKIYMLHSGAFYDVEKKLLEPGELPQTLHWFKWQNFTTWATGICLLVVVYYGNGAAFLVDPSVRDVGPAVAITLSASSLLVAWILYDGIWRSLGDAPRLATALSIVALFASIYGFAHVFSGRAAYIQTGVVIGTIMTGNVWMVIVPSQRALVEATRSGKPQDAALSLAAKQRSIHNNYLTFPLLFVMVSNHFSAATNHWLNWLVLIVVFVGGAGVRHFMNARYLGAGKELATRAWLAPAVAMGGIAIAGLVGITRIDNTPRPGVDYAVPFSRVQEIVALRCVPCHSKRPAMKEFPPPASVLFDTPEQIRVFAPRIRYRAYELANMPFLNKTAMTAIERSELAAWVDSGSLVR